MTITIDYKDGEIQLNFPYNPRYIEIIKNNTDNRRWSPEKKKWIVGLTDLQQLLIPKLLEERIPHTFTVDYANVYIEGYKTIEDFGLKYPLYPYQIEGANKLLKHNNFCNFSDTGLGKTIMSIATMNFLSNKNPLIISPSNKVSSGAEFLVVCPSSLKRQWQEEIEKFSNLKSIIIDGPKSKRQELWKTPSEIKIINYEKLRFDVEPFERKWEGIVLDEATRIKNFSSKTAKKACELKSSRKWALTATPISNCALDLYNIFRFVDPLVLGNYKTFSENHLIFEEKFFGDRYFQELIGHKNLDLLWKKIEPFYFRKIKSEVLPDLPNLIEENLYIELSSTEKQLYSYIKSIIKEKIDEIKESDEGLLSIVGEIQLLRVICNGEVCLKKSNTNNLSIINKQKDMSETSKKVDEIYNLLKTLDGKTIVFSDFTIPLFSLKKRLFNEGIKVNMLVGGVDKEKEIYDFKNTDNKIFLCQTATGGLGLNLTEATNIIFMNLPYSYEKYYQAVSRAHRMGQRKPVFVYRFITSETIEEKILETIKNKKSLSDNIIIDDIRKGRL